MAVVTDGFGMGDPLCLMTTQTDRGDGVGPVLGGEGPHLGSLPVVGPVAAGAKVGRLAELFATCRIGLDHDGRIMGCLGDTEFFLVTVAAQAGLAVIAHAQKTVCTVTRGVRRGGDGGIGGVPLMRIVAAGTTELALPWFFEARVAEAGQRGGLV